MNVREIYEQLLEGNAITLEFSSRSDYLSIYAQLRSIKSRFDAQMRAVSGLSISDGKVIRTEQGTTPETENAYRFSLADRKIIDKIQFKILDIVPIDEPKNDAAGQPELPLDTQVQLPITPLVPITEVIEKLGSVLDANRDGKA